jgi:integrase
VFSVLRDTGMMPEELHKTALRDVDLERGTINAPGLKGHLPRTLKLQDSTLAMLRRYLTETPKEYPFPTWKQAYEAWRRFRNDLTKKLSDPSLKTIRLYDLRHYFGTMLYHKTKDILYTKQQMGHQKVETTLIYAQLINFGEDEWTARIARTLDEATKLIEAGFEYVTDMESVKIFKKRK